jgi:hypothetical protein
MAAMYEVMRSLNSFQISQALHCSANSKCGIERLTQSSVAEWLEQAIHGALFSQACTDSLITLGGDKDDRDCLPANRQFPLQIRPGHARHVDIEDQAPGITDAIGRDELLCR